MLSRSWLHPRSVVFFSPYLHPRMLPAVFSILLCHVQLVERQASVGKKLAYFLTTGNLVSQSGLDLMQTSGFTVVADKINFMRFTTVSPRSGTQLPCF
jgi:hypothetical protein